MTEDINPILIKFKDLKCKIEALKNAKKLKTFLNHKLFFNHDLTESERQVEKVLRDERKRLIGTLSEEDDIGKYSLEDGKKFYYGIRNGSIKKIFRSL